MTMVPLGMQIIALVLLRFPNRMHTWRRRRALAARPFWVATHKRPGKLIESESVGGRAHGSQYIGFVWRGGSAGYRSSGTDGVSRHAIRERHWHLKVLWRHS